MKTLKQKHIFVMGMIALVLAVALAAGYGAWQMMGGGNPYKDTFYPGTTLNQMDVSGLTVAEAREQIASGTADYTLKLHFIDGDWTVSADDIGLQMNAAIDLQAIKDKQNTVKYKETADEQLALTVEGLFTYDQETLQRMLDACEQLDVSKMRAPENAKLVYDEAAQQFTLKDGDTGNTLEPETVLAAVQQAIESQITLLDAQSAGLYEKAALGSDSDNAQTILDEADTYLDISLKYTFSNDEVEQLDRATIAPWIYVDENLEVQVDHDKVQAVVNQWVEKHTSSSKNTSFTTTDGSVIELSVPVGGETIDTNALFEDIIKCMADRTSGDREVPYVQGAGNAGNNFDGNYVEVDLTNQKLYLYKDGELVMSSNIVSGSVSKSHMTPTGVYKVYSMEKNVTLRGAGYASPVSYWMPFNGGVGFHDATWRSSFGGTIYQYDGSHGCINMPFENAKTLYNTINTGYYVVVYGGVTYVPGQTTDDGQDDADETKAKDKDKNKDKDKDKDKNKQTTEKPKPTETQKPTDPEKQTEKPKPTETEKPKPTETQKPVEPEKPTEPDKPVETQKPEPETKPQKPETEAPSKPETEKPEEPDKPEEHHQNGGSSEKDGHAED